ncbi:MAG: calcium/sodium antiporter, partial [Bacillota bacterium]|nr:calcium/sodium antiporter [Bacillota bacterium]
MGIIIGLIMLVGGFVLLALGADYFVESASGIAARFGIPQLVIGLTIVAMGTSLPEAAVSITAALEGSAGISIGNVLGSNILNILIVLGFTALITSIPVHKSTVRYEIPFMLVTSVAVLIFGVTQEKIVLWEGIVLWILFIGYFIYLFIVTKKESDNGEDADVNIKIRALWLEIVLLILGAAAIVVGSSVTVEGATTLAKIMGMSDRMIGLTIVALGTSLPELVTSVTAACKGKTDIAMGNIVGSNIFNVLFVVGTTALITPVAFEAKFLLDGLVALGSGILLWLCIVKTRALKRPAGIIM